MDSISLSLKDGGRLRVYPLTYDSLFDRMVFVKDAKKQASEIADYAKTIGFEILGTPMNFPSSYRGLSISVNMLYHKPQNITVPETDSNPLPPYALQSNYPPKASQYFIINPNKDTIIVGNEGTKLFFKAGSLMSAKNVKVELKEFYSLEDYMKNGMPTVSNGQMIQTGGSVYLNATQCESENKKVKINPGIGVDIEFKLGKDDPDMQIFIKDPDSKEMNWILPPEQNIKESWVMTETILDFDGEVISKKKFTSKEAWEAHLREEEIKEKRKNEIKEDIANKMSNKLKVYDLGFINCDRFYKEPMLQFTAVADDKITAEYYLVYKNIRGVIKGREEFMQVTFGQVPKNRQATLIAVSFMDKQAYYYENTLSVDKNIKPKITLKPVDKDFLDQQLAMLK